MKLITKFLIHFTIVTAFGAFMFWLGLRCGKEAAKEVLRATEGVKL